MKNMDRMTDLNNQNPQMGQGFQTNMMQNPMMGGQFMTGAPFMGNMGMGGMYGTSMGMMGPG